jgi:hypothetical protein
MFTYVYRQLVSDVGEKIVSSTGITPVEVIPLDTRETAVTFDSELNFQDESALNEFMSSRRFFLVRKSDSEPLPGRPSDPINNE